jgi:ubiquinone/menaquinone biosynthesis C-methylase UbiE
MDRPTAGDPGPEVPPLALPVADLPRLFSAVASGYGRAALRFLPFAADRLVARLRPRAQEKVLDVATGLGTTALAVARAIQRGGRVTGIDLAEGMLEAAQEQARLLGLGNADWHRMDGQALEFRSAYFHALTCSAGLLYLPEPLQALREWHRVLRPGGRVLLTSFGPRAFEPMAGALVGRLAAAGCPYLADGAGFPWHRLARPGLCQALLEAAGFAEVQVEVLQVGYHLARADEWWEVLWGTELRGLLEPLPAAVLGALRVQHLEEVAALAGEGGIWMDVETLLVSARKPG